jgi:organic hydroperoxide reductase OsmC/OhrA
MFAQGRTIRAILERATAECATVSAHLSELALSGRAAPTERDPIMNVDHHYALELEWTGNRGTGTSGYRAYGRDHLVRAEGNATIQGSSDRAFFGDPERWNPEELMVAALAQCHMLSYLHVAQRNGVVVTAYTDRPTGTMTATSDGGGHFTLVTLHPAVTIADPSQLELAQSLHEEAGRLCFIASSVNFPVEHEPTASAA